MSEFEPASTSTDPSETAPGESRNDSLRRMLENGETPLLDIEVSSLRMKFAEMVQTQKTNGAMLGQSMQDSSETWHDNAAAEAISAHSRGLSSQANALIKILNEGNVIEYPRSDFSEATLGSVVFLNFGDGEDEPLLLTGSTTNISELADCEWPANTEAATVKSPLGQALVGSKAGETVKYLANGREISVVVKAIHQLSL